MTGPDPDYMDMLQAEAEYWRQLAETRGIALAQVERLAAELVEKSKAEIEEARRETAQAIEEMGARLTLERYRTGQVQGLAAEGGVRRPWWRRLIG